MDIPDLTNCKTRNSLIEAYIEANGGAVNFAELCKILEEKHGYAKDWIGYYVKLRCNVIEATGETSLKANFTAKRYTPSASYAPVTPVTLTKEAAEPPQAQAFASPDKSSVAVAPQPPVNENVFDSREFLRSLIPAQEEKYISRRIGSLTDLQIIELAFANKQHVLLISDTGAGKTHLARFFAYKMGLPYGRVNLNGGATVEDLVGQYVPDGSGGFRWVDGIPVMMMRHGGVLVLDEVNACPDEIAFVAHPMLDRDRQICLTGKDGEVVHASDKFFAIACMNPDYEGTRPLNQAFKDRFDVVLELEYSLRIERRLLRDQPDRDKLLSMIKKLRDAFKKKPQEITVPTSTRAVLQFAVNRQIYGATNAVQMFLTKYPPNERDAVENIIELELGSTQKSPPDEQDDDDDEDS